MLDIKPDSKDQFYALLNKLLDWLLNGANSNSWSGMFTRYLILLMIIVAGLSILAWAVGT
jgi:hypothetical protein